MQQGYERLFKLDESAKNYRIKLLENIRFLLSNDRILEASYFFNKLERINPNNISVLKLGSDVFLKKMDLRKSVEYDKKIHDKKGITFELVLNRAKLYFSTNRVSAASECIIYLIENERFNMDNFMKLINLSIEVNELYTYSKICEYIKNNRYIIHNVNGELYTDMVKRKIIATFIKTLKDNFKLN